MFLPGFKPPNRPIRLVIVKFVSERKMFGEEACGENWNTHLGKTGLKLAR